MSRLSLLSSARLLRKALCVVLFTTVSMLVIPDVTIMAVKAQTADIETLRNRVIGAVKGLNEAALRGFDDTAESISYQSKAFLRLTEQVGVDDFSDAKLVQYYALYCIYHATSGVGNEITDADVRFENIVMPEWLIATHWRDETAVDPCGTTIITTANDATATSTTATILSATTTGGWYGVTCDVEGRVVALDLFSNILTGIWPEEIVLLASDGPFNSGAGNLERLDLYQNEFLSNGGDSTWMSDLGLNISE